MNAQITLSPVFTDLVFTWNGGPYIEVWFSSPENGDFTGEVINVWDYAKGKPGIPFTPNAMESACKKFVKGLESQE